ncbi:MAG: hypothetical protein RIR26_1299 [Pseudomonadota bacterium]|jgi:lipopolysaccharide transport protein LptA
MICNWRKLKNKKTNLCLNVLVSLSLFLAVHAPARADFDDVTPTPEATPSSSTVAPTAPVQGNPVSSEATPNAAGSPARSSSSSGGAKTTVPAKGAGKASASAGSATVKSDGGLEHNSAAPVNYSAQSLEGSLTQGRILLKGDVEIQQADAVMKAEVAEIFSSKGSSAPQRAVAKGRVSMFKSATAQSAELRAVANELEYFMSNRKVILKGKPKIWRGRELLQGEVIEVFLETSEIKVRGARGVMEPSSSESSNGNPAGSGVKAAPVKKTSAPNRR